MGKKQKQPDTVFERIVKVALFTFLIPCKALGIPPRWFSNGKIRRVLEHWSIPMLWVYARSLGTRAYMDQPCTFRITDTGPRCDVAPQYRFTQAELDSFYKNGFTGPLTAVSQEEMREIRDELVREMQSESKAFGFKTVRDRHLDSPLMLSLFSRPEFTERLAQLLGPDLILWRSQFFNQEPGAPPITWHQASTYMLEDYERPILEPVSTRQMFQLTTWIAVDDATVANGCLHFARGTHDRIRTVKLGGKGGFYDAHFQMDFEPDPGIIVPMELKAGQFVIFSERCVHGSPGNRSDHRRLGLNFRTITPTTRVYREQESHFAVHLREKWNLDKWGVYLLRGEDKYHLNKPFHSQAVTAGGR